MGMAGGVTNTFGATKRRALRPPVAGGRTLSRRGLRLLEGSLRRRVEDLRTKRLREHEYACGHSAADRTPGPGLVLGADRLYRHWCASEALRVTDSLYRAEAPRCSTATGVRTRTTLVEDL